MRSEIVKPILDQVYEIIHTLHPGKDSALGRAVEEKAFYRDDFTSSIEDTGGQRCLPDCPFALGNGELSISRGVTLCVKWICRQIHSIAVCVNMKSVTVLPSRPQLDRQANGKATQHRPSLRSVKLNR